MNDPAILEGRAELGLIDARLADLLERCDSGESGALWTALQKAWTTYERFLAAGDAQRTETALVAVGVAITAGHADHLVWEEIGALVDRRSRLLEAERKRVDVLQATITVEQAAALIATVSDVIKRNVPEQDRQKRIGEEIAQLVVLEELPAGSRLRRRRR